MKSKKMCARHRNDWDVSKNEKDCNKTNDNIEILTYHAVIVPWEFQEINSTCPDCLKILGQVENH